MTTDLYLKCELYYDSHFEIRFNEKFSNIIQTLGFKKIFF